MSAGAPLLRGDDRPQYPVDRPIQPADDRVMLVEPGAVDLDHQLGAGPFERVTLKLLDCLAEHLPVQMPRARTPLEARERGLVRRTARADHESAAASRA
jgi:hypothetical protein